MRVKLRQLISDYDLTVSSYKFNAERSVLAARFVEQHDKRLLFRVYVPSGRIWAAEADKLLSLFSDWLSRIKGKRIRQGGYRTSQGQVYEFFGAGDLVGGNLVQELEEFSDFLELCVHDPDAARSLLDQENIARATTSGVIARYAKEARRLQIDLKQERESRLLSIRHRLESELLEQSIEAQGTIDLVDELLPPIPQVGGLLHSGSPHLLASTSPESSRIVINQQIIGRVEGIIAQELSGTANFGPEPAQLLELIERFGGTHKNELESAIYELEDKETKQADRLAAKERLKAFLFTIGNKAGDAGIALLRRYIESKMGL